MKRNDEATGCASIGGFQAPIGIRKRKKKVDEFIELTGIPMYEVVSFLKSANPVTFQIAEQLLDDGDYAALVEVVRATGRNGALRAYIREIVTEFVKKNSDGSGYVLYKPRGKGEKAKKVGEYPTRALAKQAELQRFPPRDPEKRKKKKKEIDRMRKKRGKAESVEHAVAEGILMGIIDEGMASRWDQLVDRMPDHVLHGDKKLQNIARDIEKRKGKLVLSVAKSLTSSLKSAGFDAERKKGDGLDDGQLMIIATDKDTGAQVPVVVAVGADGKAAVHVAEDGRMGLGKMDPAKAKALRGEVATAAEQAADDTTVSSAMMKRDAYLDSVEKSMDGVASGMSSLELAIFKKLMGDKYRKVSGE